MLADLQSGSHTDRDGGLNNVLNHVHLLITTATLSCEISTVVWRAVLSVLKERGTSLPGWIVPTELSNQALLGRLTDSVRGCVSPGPAASIKHPLPAFETLLSFFNAAKFDWNCSSKLESRGQEMRLLASMGKSRHFAGLVHIPRLLLQRCRDCSGPYTPSIYVCKYWQCCRL